MGRRRPSGRTTLAVAAVVVAALAGGAAVWIAAAGDDDPAERTTSAATAPSPTDQETVLGESSEPSAEPTITEELPADGDVERQDGSGAAETTPQGAQKTRFPPARGKARAKSTPTRFAVPPAREFSGNGNARLGTVELRAPAVVKWTTKGRFELRFGREAFPIIAPSPSGQLIVPPYSFDMVRVIADGRWTISISPQK